MKKTLVILITLLISIKSIACSCDWSGNFLRIANISELVIKGKVIEHIYHTENGKRFTNYEEYISETLNNEFDPYYGTGESIKVEIIETLRGKVKRKMIEIFDTDGADCRASISDFKAGSIYVFATYKPKRTVSKLPNETENDYAIGSCYESTLKYLPKENKVLGMIEGKFYKRKTRKYSYEKLKGSIKKEN